MNKKKILILGCNSFSGSYFVNLMLNKNFHVYGVSRSKKIKNCFLIYLKNKFLKNFYFFNYDINKDLPKIIQVIKKNKIEYIANFVAQGMVAQSWDKPEDWYLTNTLSQVKFFEQLKKFIFIKKYLHVTTPEVYGSSLELIKETFQFDPSTPYAVSRAASDFHLRNLQKFKNFPVVFSRAANVYGPGQQIYRIIPRSIYAFMYKKPIYIDGGGSSVRSFIHINDAVDAYYKILLKGIPGNIYHVSDNKFVSIKSLVFKISKILKNKNKKLIVMLKKDRTGKDKAYLLSSKKIRNQLGWNPSENLEDGIKQCIEWFVKNKKNISLRDTHYVHKQ